MNERTYLKRISALRKDLERIQNAEPYDPYAYNLLVDVMNDTEHQYHRSLRIKRWLVAAVWILLVLLLACLIFWWHD